VSQVSKIEIPVEEATAALFERTAAEARQAGLTEAEIEDELAAYNAERRA